jgi:hypothetical protein
VLKLKIPSLSTNPDYIYAESRARLVCKESIQLERDQIHVFVETVMRKFDEQSAKGEDDFGRLLSSFTKCMTLLFSMLLL